MYSTCFIAIGLLAIRLLEQYRPKHKMLKIYTKKQQIHFPNLKLNLTKSELELMDSYLFYKTHTSWHSTKNYVILTEIPVDSLLMTGR